MKKLFTLLLVLFASSTWLWAQTATAPSGSGTSGDPYLIANLDNLYWITQNSTSWDKYFRQTADIDATTTSTWDGNKGWTPIGQASPYFKGNYDGGGFKIIGLFINRTTTSDSYIGLFGQLSTGAVIQNLGIENANIAGYNYVGSLIGMLAYGNVSNCYSSGTVTGTSMVGGLIGYIYSGTVQKSYTSVAVSSTNQVGGFVGRLENGTITITDCYAKGSVALDALGSNAGSFCGAINGSSYTLNRCFSTGKVNTTSTTNLYAFMPSNGGTANNCFYNADLNGSIGYGHGIGAASHELQSPALFSTYDFTNTWRINPTENNGYPTLAWQGYSNYAVQPSGSGTSGDPYLIASLANLYWMHSTEGSGIYSFYRQTADIDASETSTWCGGQGWVSIGLYNKPWIGDYDGQNFKISNLYINRPSTSSNYQGLFGAVGTATQRFYVRNLSLVNVNITSGSSYTGALVGGAPNVWDLYIQNCNSSGTIVSGNYAGGLAGYLAPKADGNISKSYSTCSVTAANGSTNYLGGLIGSLYHNQYYNTYFGVLNCYSRGAVSGYNVVGGLVGEIQGYSGYSGNTYVNYCYSTGVVSATYNKGGLVGILGNANANYSYWDTQTSGQSSSAGGTGLTTAQMKVSSNYSNWDFTDTWTIKSGVNSGYPIIGRSLIPTITSFSPTVAATGTSVTITGTNFNATAASNIVYFGAAKATVTSGSETSLTVTVPPGATYAPITVLNTETAREARSAAYFMPTYSGKGTLAPNDFAPKADFSQSGGPFSSVVADLDGDGKPDMVSGCSDGTLNTQRNTSSSGTLSFNPASWANSGGYTTYAIAVGDFDGDGKPDVVANNSYTSFTVKRNNSSVGSINFETAIAFSNGSGGRGVAVADFDSDGKPDIVLTEYSSGTARIFRNTSNGSAINFAHATGVSGSSAMGVACGDLDGDGKPDIAIASQSSNKIDVYLNTSTGPGSITFANTVQITSGANPFQLTMADLDGDGKLDLAVQNTGVAAISVMRNTSSTGALSFAAKLDLSINAAGEGSVGIGDVDGDGKPDIVASGGNSKLSVFRNTSTSGTLWFSTKVDYTSASGIYGIGIADFDGDGKPDISTANYSNSNVSVFRNSPAQAPPTITSFTPTSGIPGSSVTISGTNFNTTATNNVVFFGSTRATVTAASANSLTVTVPTGAIYAPITVLNTGLSLSAYSSARFMPTYSGKGSITANDLAPKVNFTTNNYTEPVVMADFDGDGKPDIATGHNPGVVSVLRNTSSAGTASFATKIDLTVTSGTDVGLSVGDIDADGKPDLVVANTNSGSTISVFRNTSTSGSISFATKIDYTAGVNPEGIAVGDLDGDGKPDVAVCNLSSSSVSVFWNQSSSGSINLAGKVDFTVGSGPMDIAIADIDGDSKPDIVVTNASANTVSVLRNICNVGEINFASKTDFTTGSYPSRIVAGDIDGDGKTDLAISNYSSASVSVLRNTSTSGTVSFAAKADFTASSNSFGLGIGDLDGDGKPDLFTGSTSGYYASVLRNTSSSGSISFAQKNDYYTNNSTYGTIIGDVDGDNKPDLVISNYSAASVSVILNSPAPAPPVITSFSPIKAAVGESVTISGSGFSTTPANNFVIFGDTKAVVTSASANSLTVTVPAGASFSAISVLNTDNKMTGFSSDRFLPTYAGKGSLGTYDFDTKVDYASGSTAMDIVTGDLDGDGKSDMAVVNYGSNTMSVYRNTGSSGTLSFASKTDYAANTQPYGIAIGDLTGDGKPELAVVHNGSSIVAVYRNTSTVGTISFDAKVDYSLPSTSLGALIADVDMDGKADLLVSNQTSSSVSIFQNISGTSGTLSFAPRVEFATGTGPHDISVGDIDGDGKPDVAVATGSGVSVLRSTGSLGVLSFAAKTDIAATISPRGIRLVDLDGDAKLDIAVSGYSVSNIFLFRNTSTSGSISFAARIDYVAGTNPYDIAVGDFDGDGKPDVAVTNLSSSTISVFRNTGSSGTISMATKVDLTSASSPQGITAADMDGDGKVDLVAGCESSYITIIRNNPLTPPPTITSFSPVKAIVGVSVNISGANFSEAASNNIVFFGATRATVTAATATSLTVTVPAGATYAPITVLNTETSLSGYSAGFFMPTYTGLGTISATDFSPKVDFNVGAAAYKASMGDLDGDGKPDLAVVKLGYVSIFRNTGSAGTVLFDSKIDFALANSDTYAVAFGDLDGDGKLDVIVPTQATNGPVCVFKNTSNAGNISFAARQDVASTMRAFAVSINDMDADGKPDIVQSTNTSDKVCILRNISSGGTISFAAEQTFSTGTGGGTLGLAVGDLDGDGMPEVVIGDPNYRYIHIFRNTGSPRTINFAARQSISIPSSNFSSVSMGDIDGDGKLDIATTLGITPLSTYRNTSTVGTISFASRQDFTSLSSPSFVMLGDLDGNGKLDMAVTDGGNDKMSVYSNTGSSGSVSFSAKVDFETGDNPYWSGLIGDVDGDNRPDLITINRDGYSFSVLRNNTAIPPTITSFTPTSAASGATVTITGTDFTGATAVKFGGIAATSFNVVNATTITAVVAAGATGSVTVTTMGGTGTKAGFTFIPAPVISSFTPTSSGNGLTVTLTGTDFTGATAVSFGGTVATSFNVVNATTITAVVGAGTSGDVNVTTPGGTGTKSGFTWVAKPVISYASSPISAIYGVAITNASPTVTGTVTSYSISPTLPTGLSFNTSNGVISGTPTMISAQTDYTVSATNAGGTGTTTVTITIGKKLLTITGVTAVNREYDGTLTATLSGGTLNGVIAGDVPNVTISAGTGTFEDKNTGTGKIVTASGYGLTGSGSGNYALSAQPSGISADITQRSLTVTGATANNKEYDGAVAATFTGGTLNNKVGSEDVTLVALFGNFNNKNVGAAKPINVTSYSLGGTDFANYKISPLPTGLTANITAKELTVTGATTEDKVYDGTATAAVTGGSLVGVVAVDAGTVTLTQTANFADKNVGMAKAITANCSISGAGAANYTLAQPPLTVRNITVRLIKITATGVNKVYDGNATATVTLSDDRVSGDSFTASYSAATFADKVKETGKAVSISGITITGTDAANYSFNTTTSTSADITAKTLTVIPQADDKEYDGNTTATVSLGDNRVSGDELTVSKTSATFDNKNVGIGKTVTVSGISISGTDAANYSVATTATTTAAITAKTLAVTTTATDKVYDATAAATTTLADDRVSGDDLTLSKTSSVFDDKNVDDGKTVTVSGISISGDDAGNYVLGNVTATTTANITQKALTITASGINKEYDGDATATVTLSDDRVSGDVLTTIYTAATFPDKAKGTGKTVSVSGISISGTDAGNYIFNTTASTIANITARTLTVTATGIDKVYDQNTTAAVTLGDDRVTDDDLTTSYTSAVFANKNVAENKTVSVSAISISGDDAANYTFNTTTTATATITQKALAITATGINKVYNGTIAGSVTLSDDRISGDVLTATYTTATFSDKDVANGKTVSVSGIAISGTDAGNYTANTTVGTTANITPKALTITAEDKSKTYDGTPYTDFTVSYNGFENGENKSVLGGTLSFSGTATTAVNVGTGYVITPGGLTSTNYNITFENGSLEIIKSDQTITFNELAGKTFGEAPFDLTATASSGLTVSYTSSNTDVATISGSTVTIVGAGTTIITATQSGNGNYNAAVSVSQPLTVANQAQSIVFGDLEVKTFGDAPFTVSATGGGSGNPVVFSSSDASVATVSGNIITITGAGSCTIYANQAGNGDYGTAPYVARTLTVNKADQTVTFNSLANKIYGDAPFTLGGTASSGLTVTYISSNTDVATISGNTVTIRGVGSATITARQAGNTNYNAATPVEQTLTVVKADQTISFAALAGKTYGDAAFGLTGTASSGLAVTYSSSNPSVATISGNTVTIVGAGTTTITASQSGNVNYNAATPVEQPLTVGKSSQSISFAALAEKTYGDAPFGLTGTASSGLAVTYSSSNTAVATVSGSTITIVGAGTAIITASQVGDANYTAATSADQTLTVNKANQVLTLDPLPTGSQALKDATSPVQLTATSSSGLPVTITLGSGSAATLNGSNQLTGIGQSGTIVINVDQSGNTNYNAASISSTFDLGKPNQSILFPAMSDRIYSPGLMVDLNGSASASSTLPVSYNVISGPATLSGTVLTITGSGVVWIKASQEGDASWNAAPEVTRSLAIHKSSFIIDNFADLEKTYGDAPFTLNASSVSTGLFSYSSSNAAVATVSGNMVTIVGAGTAELTVVQAEDANYASVSTTVILKVLQADQTISFGSLADKTYGDSPFALSATATSNLLVSYTSSNPSVATVSGSTVAILGSGTTTITAMQLGNTNYKTAEPVAQTLAVGKKSQAITFDALASKTYGDAGFNLTATANSGLAVTYTSSNQAVATVSGSTVTIIGAGTTTITASQAGNENYLAATDVPQILTVSKADQVLTLSALPIGSLALKDITFPVQVSASSSSGLPVTISLGSGSAATLNGSNQLENIQQSGTITIQLNQAGNANYNAANASYSFDVEKSNQHLTFPAITNRVLSAGLTIDLNGLAYASSGLAVNYTLVSGPATLSGTVLTINGAGNVVVTASQAGNSTWNPAANVTQTISIGKAIPEITNFADLFKTYGDPTFSLNASSVSSGMITYSSGDASVATVEGSQVIIKGAGTAVLTAQQVSDNNYAQATATASLLVEKAEQTISFDVLPVKTYGDGTFGLSAISTSGLTVSYSSSDETVATVSGSTITIVGAGTANITATQAGNSNYKPATVVTRALTVNKQSQVIAFAALDGKAYGDAPFILTATGGGSGKPVTFTSSDNSVAMVSGNTVTIVGAGSCSINANQAGDGNYTAAPSVGRVLTVGKSDQTLSFDALADKTYGDAAFDLPATSTSGQAISYISSNTAVAAISGSTVTITGAGATSITAIQSGNGNYNPATPVVQSLTVIKSAQTITFTTLSGKTFGDADFILTATASSGLTVSYTSSNTDVATVSGNTVTIIGAGTTIITASQSGNGNYNAATSVSQPLTVANQGQTIVFDELSAKTYGDVPFTVSATGGGSGNPVVFTSSDASVATVSGNIITITGAGSCTIYANQAGNGDYGAAPYIARTLTVNKASQTVTFNSLADKTYGDVPFTLGGTASSGLTVTYISSNTDVATVSGNTVTIRGVGSATITARQSGNTNYNAATPVDQTLTVVKADQTITFAALADKTYGDAAFGLTGTASSGLAVTYSSSNTSVATISGNTVTIVGAGTTTITANQSGNTNYNAATPVEQPLTIGKSSQTISFAALAEKTYGDAAFDLTASASSYLPVTYISSNTAVATVSGSTVTIVGAGTAIITASQVGDANYTAATSADQTLTLNKANQVLTLDPLPTGSQALKDATGPVQLTATSSSGLPVTITLGSGSAATLNGSNQLTGIGQSGTIVVNVDQPGNTNYNTASISATFDLGKPNQSILFPAMSDRIYSPGLTIGLNGSASASSTLPVSYSVISGPATLSGTVLTVTGSGVVWIKASQTGDASWNAAPEVTRSLAIHKSSFVIDNFADLEKTYGDAAFTLSASSVSTGQFSYSSSNAAVATVSGNTVTITGAGTAELAVVQAEDANYASVSTTVILKVLQSDQTISFGPLSGKTYGGVDFALTGTASSGLPVIYSSSNPAVATVSGSTVAILGSGTTTIIAMQLGNTNYKAAEPVAQTLTVGKKSQSITFDALAGKTYGDADFNLTTTAGSGLLVTYSSSNEAVATVSGSTVTIVGAGTTTITASQSGNENYLAATDVPQTLTVSKADQVLTLSPLPIGSLALKDITFPVQVSASSSSGLPVTISLGSGSAATLNGSNQLESIQSSGTITIQLNQAGNDNYNAATASYSFDVNKSNQHITFPAITNRVLSAGLAIDLNGLAYASSGLAVNYTLVSGPATLSGTVLTISGAGDVFVTALQAGNSTWNPATDVTQTISIGKAIPEITNFADLFKTYGDLPFSLNVSSVSSGAITYSSSDETVATVEGTQVIIRGAGTAILTAQQASDANHAQATATASLLVEKAEQTLSFDALPVKTYGDDPFGLSAVSTSGLTVSYSSSNETVATVSGSTITIEGAGIAIITATQSGNSNYKPATSITRALTVNKQSQVIAFAALDGKAYGDAPFNLTATGGGSGKPVTFTSSDNSVATVSGNTVTIVGAGSCSIYANQSGDDNFTAAPQVGRVLTVGKSGQTLSFDVLADKTYGDAAFDLPATSTSGQAISYISSNTAVATISGSTVTITGAGTTSITAIQSGNGNYNPAAPVVQSLTVVKKELTVSASAESKTYDGTTSATVTLSDNRVSGDDLAVTHSSAEFNNKNVGIGKTVTVAGISFSGTDASNYTLASATTITTADITTRTLTVSTTAENKQYDGLRNAVIALSDDRVSGDVFTVIHSSAEFDNKNVGNGKTVTAGGIAISGTDAANYTLASTSVTTTANITARTLTISATADNKQYDGTTTATVSFSDDRVSGDVLAVTNSSAEFDNKNVGTGKAVTVNGLGINGTDAGNYVLASATALTTADVTVRTLTITAEDKSKEYDGLTFSNFTVSYTGFAEGDNDSHLSGILSFSGEATNATAAGIYTITPGGLTSSNYAITFVDGALEIGKTSQTIIFEPLANKAKGDADFTLTATTSSGLAVSYTSSNESVATISGSTVTIVGTGSTTITAIQPGNNNYNAANPVTQTLLVVQYIAGDVDHDGKITYPEVAGDKDGDGEITDPEKAGDTNGDGKITDPEKAGDTNGDGRITEPEKAGDTNGDGKITNPEKAGDTNGDGKITDPEKAGDTDGDGKITNPEKAGDTDGDGRITDPEKAGDTNGDGKITDPEKSGDTDGDGKITDPEKAGDTNGDGRITDPEKAGDTNGDGKITDPEITGDTDGDGKITYPEITGDKDGDGKITDPEITGDKDGDGKITYPEITGDKDGDGKINFPEVAGDTNGDGKIDGDELAGDANGDGKITSPEKLGDTDGDGSIDGKEVAGDGNGDGTIGDGETAGNTGNGGSPIAGDLNGDGKITAPEIAGDKNGDGKIDGDELAGDANGDGKITSPEKLGDTDGDGSIDGKEVAGDGNGDGTIGDGETAGNTGNGGSPIAGDLNGDGKITAPEIAGDKNGNGQIDNGELAGDTNGDGQITSPEILGDTNGDGHINGDEIAGDRDGNGQIDPTETRVIDPEKDHLNVDHLFSPNGDGINDYWKLHDIEKFGRVYVKIYDRWGTLLYESTNYQNDWSGTSKGKSLPEGAYIYFIKTEKDGDKTGVINIVR